MEYRAAVRWRIKRWLPLPREVLVLSLAGFFVAVGFGVMLPILPLYAKALNATNLQVGFIVSAFAAVRLAMSPFAGRLASRFGPDRTIAFGMYGVAISSLLMGLSHTYAELLLWRALGGFGSAAFSVSAIMLLMSRTPAELRGQASGLYQGSFLVGGMAGPAIGGLLGGLSLAAPFFFYAGTVFVAGTTCLTMLGSGRPPSEETDEVEARPATPLRSVLADRGYQAALLAAFAQGWQSYGVRNALVPLLIVDTLHGGSTFTGVAFAAAAVAQTLVLVPTGRLVDRWGRRPMMIFAGTITGIVALLLPFSPSVWIVAALLCVYGLGAAAQGTAPTAAVGDAVHGATSGLPIAVFSMMTDVGTMVGPLAAGLLSDHFGIVAAFVPGGLLLLGGAAYAMLMPRRAPREVPA